MPITIEEFNCNIFGSFKVGDNAVYNSKVLSDLVEANERGRFNKPITLQAATLIEVGALQIFYRAKHYNIEGVPNISEEDRQAIAERQIDKFAIIIDNLQKYRILDGLGAEIYDELHKLRKYRNKIHIHLNVDVPGARADKDRLFSAGVVSWALDLCWRVFNHLEEHYARPEPLQGYVGPMSLPKVQD